MSQEGYGSYQDPWGYLQDTDDFGQNTEWEYSDPATAEANIRAVSGYGTVGSTPYGTDYQTSPAEYEHDGGDIYNQVNTSGGYSESSGGHNVSGGTYRSDDPAMAFRSGQGSSMQWSATQDFPADPDLESTTTRGQSLPSEGTRWSEADSKRIKEHKKGKDLRGRTLIENAFITAEETFDFSHIALVPPKHKARSSGTRNRVEKPYRRKKPQSGGAASSGANDQQSDETGKSAAEHRLQELYPDVDV
ncbi:hypothetical protein IAT40_006525 [Kwoniella sp. CBS 6097]